MDAPGIEGGQSATLRASQFHQDGSVVDVLHRASLDIDSHALQSLSRRLEDMREQFLCRHDELVQVLGRGFSDTSYESSPLRAYL